jgi:hypothetical protein
MTFTNAFWMAPAAEDASGAAVPEGAAELAAGAADDAELAELALLPELVHPASASRTAAMTAGTAGHRRHGGEPGGGCADDGCGDGDKSEDQVCTLHHYRIARA